MFIIEIEYFTVQRNTDKSSNFEAANQKIGNLAVYDLGLASLAKI